jgi:hypothetical protein
VANDLTTLGLGRFIRLLASDKPGEIVAAAGALVRALARAGADVHELADHIEQTNGKLSETDMRTLFDAGYQQGMRDAETRFHGPEDFRSVDGSPNWEAMACYCRERRERLSDREEEFVDQMASRAVWRTPTERQGKWLKSIYLKLGGRM